MPKSTTTPSTDSSPWSRAPLRVSTGTSSLWWKCGVRCRRRSSNRALARRSLRCAIEPGVPAVCGRGAGRCGEHGDAARGVCGGGSAAGVLCVGGAGQRGPPGGEHPGAIASGGHATRRYRVGDGHGAVVLERLDDGVVLGIEAEAASGEQIAAVKSGHRLDAHLAARFSKSSRSTTATVGAGRSDGEPDGCDGVRV
eukprot:ctg_64.g21